jgi:glycosyltransferase involved in cell wall biosynthesis
MRVCIVDEIANCGFHLAKGLGNRGHKVLVVLDKRRFENRLRFTIETPANVEVKWIEPMNFRPRALGLLFPMIKEIIKFKPQIIHVNYLWSQLFIAQLAAWKLKIPIVGVGHGWEVLVVPHSRIRGVIQKFFLNKVDKIILTADYYLDELDTVKADKKVFVDRVVDTDSFHPNVDASEIREKYGDKIVTFIARLYKIKTPYTVLRAFRLVVNEIPDAKLLIMGKGPEEEGMKQFVKKLMLEENVHFLGEVPNNEIGKYLNASNVEVRGFQPRIIELGISQREALACGTPIITYYPKGDVAGVIHASNPQNISEAIIKVMTDLDYRRRLSEEARTFVEKNYSLDIGAIRTLKVYEEIFKKRGILR